MGSAGNLESPALGQLGAHVDTYTLFCAPFGESVGGVGQGAPTRTELAVRGGAPMRRDVGGALRSPRRRTGGLPRVRTLSVWLS